MRLRSFRGSIALVALCAAVLLVPGVASPAEATHFHIRFSNVSKTCAWITWYYSTPGMPWAIWKGFDSHPQFVRPGVSRDFMISHANAMRLPVPADIKLRAEFKRNADCSGSTEADYQVSRKAIFPTPGKHQIINVHASIGGPPWSVRPLQFDM
jgi:hypothetical protein